MEALVHLVLNSVSQSSNIAYSLLPNSDRVVGRVSLAWQAGGGVTDHKLVLMILTEQEYTKDININSCFVSH